ncbi:hypothetical protein ON010_g19126 [Phytophthora cinnamomi]|nr:hypothetical protein ON010_g19126 [Phytophthora cinnamomi]
MRTVTAFGCGAIGIGDGNLLVLECEPLESSARGGDDLWAAEQENERLAQNPPPPIALGLRVEKVEGRKA